MSALRTLTLRALRCAAIVLMVCVACAPAAAADAEDKVATSAEARLLLADLYLSLGRADDAIKLLSGDKSAMAIALTGRALTVAGRLDEARKLLVAEVARHPGEIEVALALADVARLQGDADEALRLFSEVAAAQPDSHEAWFGVGRVENEKENVKPARRALDEAIRLAPDAPGYYGERATLDALAGNYAAARLGFDEALRRQPDDYLAWTGLGILQLKTGETEAALESFLKAGVIEPRFARARLYAGVAYYRLENKKAAIESINKAAELDPKDPLPYMMLGLMHGDALELRAAIDAAREAQARMSNLKSLNQIANNQKGSANVGSALAAQGMEEWARNYASKSYTPYWAGSPLFLADRYPDSFNKNTELYKGYLIDPTVFGASNRASSLVQTPGHYGSIGYLGTQGDFLQNTVQGKVNGLVNSGVPLAYSFTGEYADGHDNRPNVDTFQAHGTNATLGLGAKPTYELGLFYFGTNTDVKGHFNDDPTLPRSVSQLTDAQLKVDITRQDAGFSYRFNPTNQISFKVGDGSQRTRLSGSYYDPVIAAANAVPPVFIPLPGAQLERNDVNVEASDIQFRHSFDTAPGTRLTWGAEYAQNRSVLDRNQTYSAVSSLCGGLPCGELILHSKVERALRSSAIYFSGNQSMRSGLELQLDLNFQYTTTSGSAAIDQNIELLGFSFPARNQFNEQDTFRELNPRVGIHFSPDAGKDLRFAYQRWRRPVGTGSLGLTETVGIAIEDRLVDTGGMLDRAKARFDWALGNSRFIQLSADFRQVHNLQSSVTDYFRQFGLSELATLRARKPVFDEAFNELEKTPVFGKGQVANGGVAANWLLTDKVAVAGRYLLSSSRNNGDAFVDKEVPFIPRHFLNLSTYWQLGGRWLFSTVANYRSQRFMDEANTQLLDGGWDFGLRTYWESQDKRWSVEAAANNLHANKYSAIERRSLLNLNSIYRF